MKQDFWTLSFPGLDELDSTLARSLCERADVLRFDEGQLVLGVGHVGGLFPFVLEGSVRVTLLSEEGREVLLYRLEPGGTCTLSAACLLSGNRVGATVSAESQARIAVLPALEFHELMDSSKTFRDYIFTTFAARLSELVTRMDTMLFRSVESRLAEHLLGNASEGEVQATHADLARELGTAREVISRRLKDLDRRGWISMQRGRIVLREPQELERLVHAH